MYVNTYTCNVIGQSHSVNISRLTALIEAFADMPFYRSTGRSSLGAMTLWFLTKSAMEAMNWCCGWQLSHLVSVAVVMLWAFDMFSRSDPILTL
jgi:hypothetical protein